MMWRYRIVLLLCLGSLASCRTTRLHKNRDISIQINDAIHQTNLLQNCYLGISIRDVDGGNAIFEYHADKLFTPASNVKILTAYAAKHYLKDSLLFCKWIETDSTVTLWSCGDPSPMKNGLPEGHISERLKSVVQNKKVYISTAHADISPFGNGWMWDDYGDDYQAEISAFPIYGNVLTVFGKDSSLLEVMPFSEDFVIDRNSINSNINRDIISNVLSVGTKGRQGEWMQEIPIYNAEKVNKKLWENRIGTALVDTILQVPEQGVHLLHSIPLDTTLRLMMERSDNMIAEQCLLQIGMSLGDTLNSKYAIDTVLNDLYLPFKNELKWVDGSGLSRYNQISPSILSRILGDMYNKLDRTELLYMMPKIKLSLPEKNQQTSASHFYAKSGSMSSVYNLSGYIVKPSGKTYTFSIMVNHFLVAPSKIKKEVLQLLQKIDLLLAS